MLQFTPKLQIWGIQPWGGQRHIGLLEVQLHDEVEQQLPAEGHQH